jgi:penicillin G amidase
VRNFLIALTLCCSLADFATAEETADSLRTKAKAALAQLEGEIALPGLTAPVEVLRDRWGVPHIYAQNETDLFFAQGFVVAQDRLFQLDVWRRVGLGETAAVVGEKGLAGDRFARLMRFRGDMDREWASYSPDAKQIAASTRPLTRWRTVCRSSSKF